MSRRVKVGAGLSLGALAAMPAVAHADDITVTNLDDSGVGSLRAAIESADADADADRILFSSALSGEILLTTGQLEIETAVEVAGPGAEQLSVSGGESSRIFSINTDDQEVTISGLTLTDGHPTGGPSATRRSLAGGAISVRDTVFVLSQSVLTDNVTDAWGGAIFTSLGDNTIESSTISGNLAPSDALGGGTGSSGGITAYDAMTIEDSTISNNVAVSYAGGIEVVHGPLTISNSTIAGNDGGEEGGGIFSREAAVNLDNTIVADNTADEGADLFEDDALLTTFDGDFNLIEDLEGAGDFTGSANVFGLDPDLEPLADNGGQTPTHALPISSPAVDQGTSVGASVDQRGMPRPLDLASVPNSTGAAADGADIGAFELQGAVGPTGTVEIHKQTIPDGDPKSFSFSAPALPGTSNDAFSLSDGETRTVINVPTGNYNVTEAVASGYQLDDLSCDDDASANPSESSLATRRATVGVDAGETVRCTFTSERVASAGGGVKPSCRGQAATVIGTPGNDILRGTAGDDVIVGLDGNDTLRGKDGRDIICGARGDDKLKGGPGRDTLSGGPGKDQLKGGPGNDELNGGPGKDEETP